MLPRRHEEKQKIVATKRKYSTPIVLAADELRRRFENIIQHIDKIEMEAWLTPDELDPSEPEQLQNYYYMNTLYRFGCFFGWLEHLRRTIVYLDFTSVRETRVFANYLELIKEGFSTPRLIPCEPEDCPDNHDDQWVYKGVLQAIGELMVVKDGEEYGCIGFTSFEQKLKTEKVWQRWFESVHDLFVDLKKKDARFRRIIASHALLNSFIEFTDSSHIRTRSQQNHVGRLTMAEKEALNEHARICGVKEFYGASVTILYLHGYQSAPGGTKPSYMSRHGHKVVNPALPDDKFEEAVRIAQREFDHNRPSVVVGSSRGGAIAMNIQSGRTPLVLLAPSWKTDGSVKTVKSNTTILHSRMDDVVPFADSEELVRNSGLPATALVQVGNDHRLADLDSLIAMLEACLRYSVTDSWMGRFMESGLFRWLRRSRLFKSSRTDGPPSGSS